MWNFEEEDMRTKISVLTFLSIQLQRSVLPKERVDNTTRVHCFPIWDTSLHKVQGELPHTHILHPHEHVTFTELKG